MSNQYTIYLKLKKKTRINNNLAKHVFSLSHLHNINAYFLHKCTDTIVVTAIIKTALAAALSAQLAYII